MKHYSLLEKIHAAAAGSFSPRDSLSAILALLTEAGAIRAGTILLNDTDNSPMTVFVTNGGRAHDSGIRVAPGEGLCGRAALSGKPVTVPDLSSEPLYLDRLGLCDRKKGAAYMALPLFCAGRCRGVLCAVMDGPGSGSLVPLKRLLTLTASAISLVLGCEERLHQEREQLSVENTALKQKLQQEFSFHNLVGNSHEMRDIYEQVARVARSSTTVLLRGESGTGKELIAEAVHYNSARRDKPFVRVNCAAIPESLIESEFFGYEKGAFTGAAARKKGRFELADCGTVFLDEIGELSPLTQVKLLRVLQDRRFERVGGTETIAVDLRVIAATNADLEKLMKAGAFREDLYYRLNVFSIFLPPLRERRTDIMLLADHFMLKYGRQQGKVIRRLSTPAIDMLMAYHWPGNVRELENCIERAVLVCDEQVIHSYHLPPSLQTAESSNTSPRRSLAQAVTAYEKDLIQDALKAAAGNRAKASRLLGTTERIIGYRIQKLGIQPERFKL